MRWFKHMTDSFDDEFVSELVEKFGLEGYGAWWRILEVIARQMQQGSRRTSATYSIKKWKNLVPIYRKSSLNLLLIFCESHAKLTLIYDESNTNLLTIDCPKLMKFRDEYAERKSKNRDKLPTLSGQTHEQDTETDTETEKEKTPLSPPPQKGAGTASQQGILKSREELLSRYSPAAIGLIESALRAIATTRKTGKLAESVSLAELRYWDNFDPWKVTTGIATYLDQAYYTDGKDERYLRGIIRNAKPEDQNYNRKKGAEISTEETYPGIKVL